MSFKIVDCGIRACACIAVMGSVACSSSPASPSTSSTTSTAAPAPAPAPVVAATASVQITVTPNPVPFSGVPITDSAACAGSPNTWFYSQELKESGGASVTFTSRIDSFDQRVVNNVTTLNLTVPAMGSVAVSSRWCSVSDVSHTAQSTFMGTDANGHVVKADGPVVNMRSLH